MRSTDRDGVPSAQHLSPEARAAWDAWQDSTLDVAEHLIYCGSGCDVLAMRCPAGGLYAEAERSAWRSWHEARNAEG